MLTRELDIKTVLASVIQLRGFFTNLSRFYMFELLGLLEIFSYQSIVWAAFVMLKTEK